MTGYVLDTSAFLAYLWREPGGERVAAALEDDEVAMSAVNIAEVLTKVIERGLPVTAADDFLASLDFEHVTFDNTMAVRVAVLRPATRLHGLSLGDRACLVLAQTLHAIVLTADRPWLDLDVGVKIECIR